MTPPTLKRQVFAKEYLVDRNATQAAIRSGYSERTAYSQGSRLLKHVEVQTEIAALERAQQEAAHVDRAYVINKLQHIVEYGEKESNRLRAAELLGKCVGLFTEQLEVHTTHDINPLAEFTVDQLRALLASQQQPAVEAKATEVD